MWSDFKEVSKKAGRIKKPGRFKTTLAVAEESEDKGKKEDAEPAEDEGKKEDAESTEEKANEEGG